MYSNQENPSHKPLETHTPESSVDHKELSPAVKNASIAALVAVLAITAVSSLIVGANTNVAEEVEETEEIVATTELTEEVEATAANAADASSLPPAPEVPSAVEAISDPGKLAELNGDLYNTVDSNWRYTAVTADSRYRVRVTEDGQIAEYEPTNQAAADNVQNTPLPNLVVDNSPAAGESPTVPYADFE
ncbi:MAG: hypothetical protein F6K35_30000, partial [Okeania sp. SIO2H7]|nr:hypothetical protein [Okeania sp. SIO2H7]